MALVENFWGHDYAEGEKRETRVVWLPPDIGENALKILAEESFEAYWYPVATGQWLVDFVASKPWQTRSSTGTYNFRPDPEYRGQARGARTRAPRASRTTPAPVPELRTMKLDLLLQATQMAMDDVFGAPRITVDDLVRELRHVMRADPVRAERAVSAMYGGMFKRKESARNPWAHPDTGEVLVVDDERGAP